jgi:hypothetical protein
LRHFRVGQGAKPRRVRQSLGGRPVAARLPRLLAGRSPNAVHWSLTILITCRKGGGRNHCRIVQILSPHVRQTLDSGFSSFRPRSVVQWRP